MFRYVSEPQSKKLDIQADVTSCMTLLELWILSLFGSHFSRKKRQKPQNCGDKHDVRFLFRSLTHCRGWNSLFGDVSSQLLTNCLWRFLLHIAISKIFYHRFCIQIAHHFAASIAICYFFVHK
jgi:hypothetical protein